MDTINIQNRSLEKSPKNLRDKGFIPGVLYGPTLKNIAVKMSSNELRKATKKAGEVYRVRSKQGVVFVKFDEIQRDPVTREPFHFSLVQMPKGEESEVEVPIHLEGTPIGVQKGGSLVVMKDHLNVSGMPRSIPKEIVGDVTHLNIGDKLTIDDLKIPNIVSSTEEETEVVAICRPPIKEKEVSDDWEEEELRFG